VLVWSVLLNKANCDNTKLKSLNILNESVCTFFCVVVFVLLTSVTLKLRLHLTHYI